MTPKPEGTIVSFGHPLVHIYVRTGYLYLEVSSLGALLLFMLMWRGRYRPRFKVRGIISRPVTLPNVGVTFRTDAFVDLKGHDEESPSAVARVRTPEMQYIGVVDKYVSRTERADRVRRLFQQALQFFAPLGKERMP